MIKSKHDLLEELETTINRIAELEKDKTNLTIMVDKCYPALEEAMEDRIEYKKQSKFVKFLKKKQKKVLDYEIEFYTERIFNLNDMIKNIDKEKTRTTEYLHELVDTYRDVLEGII